MKSIFSILLGLGLGSSVASAAPVNPSERIDELVGAALEAQGIAPNADISDAVFLRRAYADIIGRIPTIEEAEEFHSESYENKRERLIDHLLDSEGYVSDSYHFWADMLRINGEPGRVVSKAYELWVKDALRKNMPYDKMVHSLVTAEGKFWENGAVGYYFRDRGMPLDNMSNTVRIFLGTRLECAQCHNHPFDKWTQMDYFKMASFSFGMNTRAYDSANRSLAMREIKGGGISVYREKAQELTGRSDFPYFAKLSNLEQFLGKVSDEVAKAPEPEESVEPKDKKELRRRKLAKKKRKRSPSFADFEMSKEKFETVAKQCMEAAEEASGRRSTMREVLKELYDPLQYTAVTEGDKNSILPHDYQYDDAKPKDEISAATMFGNEVDLASADSKIDAYGEWLTSPENPTFTRVIANRLWKEVFGLGIFEPVDELTDHTPITNPELLAYLEELMKELNYDMKEFQAVLYNTKTYQRGVFTGEVEMGAPYYFQGPILRRMSSEQIWDSLVALSLPEADRYQPNLEKDLSSIDRIKKIYESLEERPYDEFIAMVKEIAPIVEEQEEESNEYREKVAAARESGDTDAIREIRASYSNGKKKLSRAISEIAYKNLDKSIDGGELLLAMGFVDAGSELSDEMESTNEAGEKGVSYITTSLPGAKGGRAVKQGRKSMKGPMKKQRKKAGEFDRGALRAQKEDIRVYQNLVSGMARASELPSPSKRGHFLRDFGQSDREVIENASNHASVPQALNLLNGPMVEALVNRYSLLGNRIHTAGDVDEKARMIFQAMLTREPTDTELNLVRAEIEAHGEEGYEGIVWALLNTQQFLFVE